MKKILFCFLAIFSIFSLFSLEIPDSLYGIWEGKDRFVFFEKSQSPNPQIVILLKEYYGWYYDRAAEPAEYNQKEPRIRNSATTRQAENIYFEVQPIQKADENLPAWELSLTYSKNQTSKVPITILNDNIFLDFYIQDKEDKNFYRGNAVSEGIKISQQKIPENLACFYIFDDENAVVKGDFANSVANLATSSVNGQENLQNNPQKILNIRYWKSDMDFSDEKVTLKYGEKEFYPDKHVFSGGNNYSAVSGRSKKIRNVVEPQNFTPENYIFNEDKSILILDKEPYLTKLADKSTFEDLMALVKAGNSRRKPDPALIFPPDDLNWHWDLIDLLEADNKIIQAVRSRQKAFGSRPKDLGK